MLSSKAKRELKIDQRQVLIESIEIGIASPQQIYLRGSRQLPNGKTVGLIKNSKTVNYKKFTPFRDGLFCERIFGPVTSLVCACGKKQPHSKITFCEKCEVEYIDQRSRRYRLGYISLLSPVTHIWYLKGRPSYLSLFLGKRKKTVVSLAYCNSYLIDHIPFKKEDEHQYKSSLCKSEICVGLTNRSKQSLTSYLRSAKLRFASGQSPDRSLLCNDASPEVIDRVSPDARRFVSPSPAGNPRGCNCLATSCKAKPCISTCKSICTPSKAATFVQHKSLSVSHLSKSDNLLQNNAYQFFPFIKKSLLLRKARGHHRIALASPNKSSCKTKFCFCKGKIVQNKALHGNQRSFVLACGNRKAKTITFTKGDVHPLTNLRVVSGRKRMFLVPKVLTSALACKSSLCKSKQAELDFVPLPFGQGQGEAQSARPSPPEIKSNRVHRPICTPTHDANRFQKDQIPLKLNRFLVNNRSVVNKNKNDFYRSTSYGKYFYTRQQCLPFLPSFVSHFYLRDALLNFMYSSPISEDIPILEYCNTKRLEPLQDVHKFMARQTVDKFKNADLSVQSIKSSFTAFLPKVFRKRRSVAKLNFAQRGGEPRAPSCKRVHVSATLPFSVTQSEALHTSGDQEQNFMQIGDDGHSASPKVMAFGQRKSSICSATPTQIMPFGQRQGEQTKTGNVSKTSLSAFRLKMLYPEKKHVYLDSFFKKIYKQNTVNSTSDLIKKNVNEETTNTTLSNLELTAIREILSYTGGGAIQQLLKQFDPHDLCKFLVAERQILRALYQKHIAFTRDGLDLQPSSALDYISNVSEYQDNFSIIEKPFFSTAVRMQEGNSEARFVAKSDKNEPLSKSPLNGFPLQEKGLFWGLENKKTQLYQKKEIMRISRRIYKVARRLKVAQLLTLNHRRPEWMILSHLPVLPPDLRPILQMSEKVIVASDLNIMYQRVIYRNNRHLRVRFIDFQLVTAIQRLVQDAVDRLMENGKGGSKPYYTQGGRPLKSLSDILKGKKGRFRLNLLGKRVDFSGRSVIVVAPSLKIHECGLPKDIALELYHYFLLRQLIVKKYCASIVTAKKMIKSKSAEMWDVLREVMYHHPVLLNRAPTLHRLGIQAFQPKLVVGSAIWLHPLVCSGFNADFDGDQMGVHLPLSFAARAESWDLLWSRNNLLSPATGQPMLVPSQDMVLGFYYMTAQGMANRFSNLKRFKTVITTHKKEVNKIIVFLNPKSIITNYQNGILKLHTPVWLHWEGKIENENNSATPFELRVSGFGAQRYVFENYISNALFSGHASASALACKSKQAKLDFVPLVPKICKPCPCPSGKGKPKSSACFDLQSGCKKICIPSAEQSEALRASRIATPCPCPKGMGIAKASFIFPQPKASYIRTTAGRVLMNNILKK